MDIYSPASIIYTLEVGRRKEKEAVVHYCTLSRTESPKSTLASLPPPPPSLSPFFLSLFSLYYQWELHFTGSVTSGS